MRILIADDEKLTRDGLISSINWDALPFDYIDQADDGMNGVQLAKSNLPDVLLTDIRMPRMNGIELATKVQEMNPNCSIIFMSGYSDKEYLMAAIKLRAVRYVEKPINPVEVTEALTESVNAILQTRVHMKSRELMSKEASSRFAQNLTRNNYNSKTDTSLEEAGLRELVHSYSSFTTYLIKIKPQYNSLSEEAITHVMNGIHSIISRKHCHETHFIKQDNILVMHVFSNDRLEKELLYRIANEMKGLLPAELNFFIVVGKTVTGPSKVFQSYNSAVILLQSSFFYEYGSVITYDHSTCELSSNYPYEFTDEFTAAIRDKEIGKARTLAETFYKKLQFNHSILPNTIKDVYYKLFMQIIAVQYSLKLSTQNSTSDSESLLESVSGCDILYELHRMLVDKIDEFARLLQSTAQENPTIFMIRDYISKHYGDFSLSIKDISDHVHLSSSYLCTVFKTETGKTLNQFITDYRIEKAKQLLADPRNKITEISSRVGYSDGNYFGKSFKKEVGLSPSEYREKELNR